MDFREKLIAKPNHRFRLRDRKPDTTHGWNKDRAKKRFKNNIKRLDDLQHLLYAEDKHALLVVFQAMDAGGKDGTIRDVMSGMNPQGVRVTSFKAPSSEELQHDFLWRIHRALPRRGEIGVFNRSHYEDVLIVRVHDLVPKQVWRERYDQINRFERNLSENGFTILKFFLHISPDEQKKRFEKRLDDPRHNWKFNPADLDERKLWDDYQRAYEDAVAKCSTPWAPWFVIPSDRKWFRNLAVSDILMDALDRLKMRYPKPLHDLSKIHVR